MRTEFDLNKSEIDHNECEQSQSGTILTSVNVNKANLGRSDIHPSWIDLCINGPKEPGYEVGMARNKT